MRDNNKLRNYILNKMKEGRETYVDLELSVTLPCGCCTEGGRRFYAEEEDMRGKTDNQLICLFKENSEVFLNHVTNWYESGNTLCLDTSGDD